MPINLATSFLTTSTFSENIQPTGMDPAIIYNTLREQFYVQIPVEISPKQINEAIAAFFAYLNEPDEIKFKISTKISPQHRRGELGLVHRDPSQDGYGDKKDFFHYHPKILHEFEPFVAKHDSVKHFLSKADAIWHLAAKTVKKVLLSLENYYPNLCDKVFNTNDPHLVLRFLRYEWDCTQEVLAKPHFDAGSFTLALAESCPGLRIGSLPENLKKVEHKEEKAIFMLGANSKKLIPNGELLPGWHDVIMINKEQIGLSHARWAIVMFIDCHDVEAPSRNDCHPWSINSNPLNIKDRT